MTAIVFDPRVCQLGEGAFWHPSRRQFFWFDIHHHRLLSRTPKGPQEWRFRQTVSAAGWVDDDHLLIAAETGLLLFDIITGNIVSSIGVEADRGDTRSNDGRADRQGGFWFSTMGRGAEFEKGCIYRFLDGRVVCLFDKITIPNAICFSPDGRLAYFADTALGQVWAQPLDDAGWPDGERRIFLDLHAGQEKHFPDGAVTDEQGGFWCAIWGMGMVARYSPSGVRTHEFKVGGVHSSCPAFGGEGLTQMLVTTALQGIKAPDLHQGLPYLLETGFTGLAEPRIRWPI